MQNTTAMHQQPNEATNKKNNIIPTALLLGGFAALAAAAAIAWKRHKPIPFIPTPQMRMNVAYSTNGRAGTALITGASSGIGAAYAKRFAKEGYDLILVARREDKLRTLAQTLQQHYPIRAEVLVADLAQKEDIAKVEERIRTCKHLNILVNNAGFGRFGAFYDVDVAKHLDMINVHVNASVRFCHAALPTMIARGSGVIINVSSIAAFLPRPNNVTYNATKIYLKVFTEGLHAELAGTGVRVQALFPGLTKTEFFERPEIGSERVNVPSFLWMTSEEVVDESLKALQRGKVLFLPGLKNRILLTLMRNATFLKALRGLINYRSAKTASAATPPQ